MRTVLWFRTLFFVLFAMIAVGIGISSATAAPYGKSGPQVAALQPSSCGGSTVNVTGKGFQPGEVVVLQRDGATVSQVGANSAGSFSAALGTSGMSNGAHTVSAVGATSASSASTVVDVRTSACSTTAAPVPTSSASTVQTSGLAFTGVQVAAMSVFAVVVLVGGSLLVLLGRRRHV